MPTVKTRKAAAAEIGVNERTLGTWKLEPTFPDCKAGYDIAAIQEWRLSHRGKLKYDQTRRTLAQINQKLDQLLNLFSRNDRT